MRSLFIFLLLAGTLLTSVSNAETLRISAEQLKKILNENITIVDVRLKNDFEISHIKGAVNFPVEQTYSNKKINGQIVQPNLMQAYIQNAGLDLNSRIIIYDGGQLVDAARVFWAFEVYGLKNIKVLDHGFDYWLNKKYPTSQEPRAIKPSQYVISINHKRLSSKFTTQLAINNRNKLIIDARNAPAYKGETSVAKRFGHIPSAVNVPYSHNILSESTFSSLKPIDELKKLYADIPLGKKVIIYCKIGRVSSTNYFVLRELGHDVSNYDASWREWGNDHALPIEK